MMPGNQTTGRYPKLAEKLRPGVIFIAIICVALLAFEMFNYSTTDLALKDMLGDLTFMNMQWSTILALAFCGIDFAGIARMFTPEQGLDEPKEVWYLFGAWLLAATMNAILTWWGVSIAVSEHAVKSSTVIDPKTITNIVPVFVAIMVWVIRILIIGTLSLAMDRLLHPGVAQARPMIQTAFDSTRAHGTNQYHSTARVPSGLNSAGLQQRPMPARSTLPDVRPVRSASPAGAVEARVEPVNQGRPEPTYHSMNGGGSSRNF